MIAFPDSLSGILFYLKLDLGGEYTPIAIDAIVAPTSAGVVNSYSANDGLTNFDVYAEMGYGGTNTKVSLRATPSASTQCTYIVTVKYIKTRFFDL